MDEKERKELLYAVIRDMKSDIEKEQTKFLNASLEYLYAVKRYNENTLHALNSVLEHLHNAGIED